MISSLSPSPWSLLNVTRMLGTPFVPSVVWEYRRKTAGGKPRCHSLRKVPPHHPCVLPCTAPRWAQRRRCPSLLAPGSSPGAAPAGEPSTATRAPTLHRRGSRQSARRRCSKPVPGWLCSQQRGRGLACNNLPTGRGLLPAAGHTGDMDSLETLLARTSAVSSQATPQLARAAPSWFCMSLLWHSLGVPQERNTELSATACLAVCPQLRAAETQRRIAMATSGLTPSLALAQAQLEAHLQVAE